MTSPLLRVWLDEDYRPHPKWKQHLCDEGEPANIHLPCLALSFEQADQAAK